MLIATNFPKLPKLPKLLKLSILTVRTVETLGPLRGRGQSVIPRSGLNGHRGLSGPIKEFREIATTAISLSLLTFGVVRILGTLLYLILLLLLKS